MHLREVIIKVGQLTSILMRLLLYIKYLLTGKVATYKFTNPILTLNTFFYFLII